MHEGLDFFEGTIFLDNEQIHKGIICLNSKAKVSYSIIFDF